MGFARAPENSFDHGYDLNLLSPILNYIFGAGVLGIPYCFIHGGLLASSLALVVSSSFSLITGLFLFEVQTRAQLVKLKSIGNSEFDAVYTSPNSKLQITTHNQLEIPEICDIFRLQKTKLVYTISTLIFMVSSTWIYCTIFAQVLSNFFDENLTYSSCVFIFGVLQFFSYTIPPTILRRFEQSLTIIALLSAVVIVVWTGIIIFTSENTLPTLNTQQKYFNFREFGSVFDSFVFAQVIHSGIPLIGNMCKTRSKLPFFNSLKVSMLLTTVLYLFMGLFCAIVFGEDTDKIISNNFKYIGGGSSVYLARFLELLPCVSVSAAFSMYTIALSNSLYKVFPNIGYAAGRKQDADYSVLEDGEDTSKTYDSETSLEEDNTDVTESPAVLRLLCTAAPIILAFISSDTQSILGIIGSSAIFVSFYIPTYLLVQSRISSKYVTEQFTETIYSTPLSSAAGTNVVFIFATLALVYSTLSRL